VVDGLSKILKENKIVQNWSSLGDTAVTEFRVRCFQPLSHLSAGPRMGRRSRVYL